MIGDDDDTEALEGSAPAEKPARKTIEVFTYVDRRRRPLPRKLPFGEALKEAFPEAAADAGEPAAAARRPNKRERRAARRSREQS